MFSFFSFSFLLGTRLLRGSCTEVLLLLLLWLLLRLLHLWGHVCPFVLVVPTVPKLVRAPGAGRSTPLRLLGQPGLLLLLATGGSRGISRAVLVRKEQLVHLADHG